MGARRRLMRMGDGPTLARKILLRVLPVVILSVCVVGWSNYMVAQVQISHYIDKEVRMLAEQVAVSADNFLDQRTRDMATLDEAPLLNDYHVNMEFGLREEARIYQQAIEQYFLQFANRSDVYDLVAYYDASGEWVAGVADGAIVGAEGAKALLPVGLTSIRAVGTYRSAILGEGDERKMVLASSVTREEEFRGTLVLVCNLASLADILHRSQIGQEGRAYLADGEGEAVLGKQPSGLADLHHKVPLKGSSEWVVVEAHAEEFIGPLARLRNLTLLLSFGVAVLVSGVLIAGIRWTMQPLNEVTEGTRRLAMGELDYRLRMPEVRDLKPLALAFNRMADRLKERDGQLQARIRELSWLRLMENTATERISEEAVLRTCLRAVVEGLGFDRAALYWIDRKQQVIAGRYLHATEASEFREWAFRKRSVPLGDDDLLNRVIVSRKPLMLNETDQEAGVDLDEEGGGARRTLVLAPLCGKEEVFGVIVADNGTTGATLNEHHRDGLGLFASAAGLSLENAMLIDRITESESQHRMVLENSPLAILGVSRDHRIHTWNRGAEAIFGYTAAQIIGQPVTALLAPEATQPFQALLERLMQEGVVHEYQIKGRSREGALLDLSLSWGGRNRENFIANDEWTLVIHDVTESRKLQRKLIAAEKLSAVGQLIAGVAHELNNPLQAVVGYAELLLESAGEGHGRDELQHVFENAARCRKIVDNLLLFVRHGGVEQRAVCIQETVEGSLNLLRHKLTRGGASIDIVRELPAEPLYVKGNFQQIEQVLINLLTNACDALEGWEGRREVRIEVSVSGERVRVAVSDSGPGVAEEVREQLFEPLFTTKPEGHGTGLGLPLCREIIESCDGGRIGHDRSEAGGATFYFELRRIASPAPAPASQEVADEAVRSQRVLLLEDEGAVRAWLRDVLTAEGHDVEESETVEGARRHAARERFDLVVSDIHLPDGTGMELFRGWGRYSRQPRPRFLFLTGDIIAEEVEAFCHESGARILQKPVKLRDLRRVLRELVVSAELPVSSPAAEG